MRPIRLRRPNLASLLRPAARARGDGALDFYGPAVVGPATIGRRALDPALLDELTAEIAELDEDQYTRYVASFVDGGRRRAGMGWRYADITTVLAAATELLQPATYLEIGVRRGRSMCIVARRAPTSAIFGVDLWQPGYAGMDNPGPPFVEAQLRRVGHRGDVRLIHGRSQNELPRLFRDRPDLALDLVTVDGDHADRGAASDLRWVIPRIRVGGALVFDDISHPAHPGLRAVWRRIVEDDRRFATWIFDDVGYGVAVGVRRW